MVEDVENENSNVSNSNKPVLLNTPLSDKVECFDPGDDIDEIDAFLAMEVSSNFEEGYYDSEGDVIFLESLLSDDTTHNLSPEVIFDHEPQQNESIHNTSITFSPRNDPLHHEFAGEIITNPSRIAREHEEYLSLMTLLCEISTSRDPVQEEIDLFPGPDDLTPPGVENDDSEDEDNSMFFPKNESSILDPSFPRPPPEPPDVCLNFEPNTAVKNDFIKLNEDFNQGEMVLSLNVEDVDSFTFVTRIFLPYITYPKVSLLLSSTKNEDTIFDPGTDNAKISRKRSKLDNHGHGNGIECAKAGRMLSKLVQETTEKISQIKDRLKAACDRQKIYADKRRKPLEFSVGTPWQSYTSSKAPIGQFPKGNDTRTRKETHQGVGFCTKTLTKEAQECHITDCHAGNPCELRFDLTDHNGDPIIGRNGGTGFKGACEGLDT
ncbi:hypothetical protein Tco_1407477 [Tanacetum coccineum]